MIFLRLGLLFIVSQLSITSLAEDMYVRDTLYVPLRGGESSSHKIIHQGLKSGTRLERLETNESSGYSKVVTPGGQEGWIQSQYLVSEPIAKERLNEMSNQLASMEKKYALTLTTLAEQKTQVDELQQTLKALDVSYQATNSELVEVKTLSSNVIEIDLHNQALVNERSALAEEIDDLKIMNTNLADNDKRDWFTLGAATIFLGLLLGFGIARKIYHRQGGSWS